MWDRQVPPAQPLHPPPRSAPPGPWVPGFVPQQPQQLRAGRCSHTGSAEQKGGRVKPCLRKRGHADTQGHWQEGGLVRMGIKKQNTNGFCNKILIQSG